jgi:hypothetical protein
MQTLECPHCGAPITYQPNLGAPAQCIYCHGQLTFPGPIQPEPIVMPHIDITIGPQVATTASRALWFIFLIPIIIVVIVFAAVFGAISQVRRALMPLTNSPIAARPLRPGDTGNGFVSQTMKFGSEGIGPGMMTDARSIAVDGQGNIYVGEYTGGRIQVFDANGKFITQWTADPKMPLRGLAVDRKGTVYVVQRGIISRYDGQTGNSLGKVSYPEGDGFDDVTSTPDGGIVAAYQRGNDDIVQFDSQGNIKQIIRKAISTPADRSELSTRVAVDGRGNIYGLGSFTSAVFKFSRDGKFMNRFGGPGSQPGQFRAVSAIAIDGKGRVFVSDIQGVQVFDSDGRFINVFKPEGSASGMTFNDQNELLIVSRSKVQKFTINQ